MLKHKVERLIMLGSYDMIMVRGNFFVDTTEGINVVLLGRDTEGKSRINLVDPNGVFFIKNDKVRIMV